MKLLMVCMGNICRSPMMEGWLRDAVARQPALKGKIEVDSAAIGAWHVGQPPDPRAIAVAKAHGIDIAGQRARRLEAADFARFDLILFADAETLRAGRERAADRAQADGDAVSARYLDWAGVDGDHDLADPYYGDARDFAAVWQRVGEGGAAILERLQTGIAA